MIRRNWMVLVVLTGVVSLLAAGPAFAKKSGSSGGEEEAFNPEQIERCKIESVNRLSEKTERLATEWGGLKGKVDVIPMAIGKATGEEVATIDAALEQLIALDLPLKVDVAALSVTVDREDLDDKQTAVADSLDGLVTELKQVPDAAVKVSDRAVSLGGEIADFIPGVAGEFQGNPLQSAVEVPKATKILKGQVDYLKALPEEIDATMETVKAFFNGLAEVARQTGADVEEAATTSQSDTEEEGSSSGGE